MRVYTLALSMLVHVAAVAAIIVAPLIATDVLPEPRRAIEFVEVRPIAIEPPPPPPHPRTQPQTPALPSSAAPVDAPAGIEPEPVAPPPVSLDAGPSTSEGVPLLGAFAGSDSWPPPAADRPPVRVGGAISRPERIRYVAPVYPALARVARVEGTVILEAVLGTDGSVREARVLRSVQLLDDAALEAVQQWQFTPTLLNGEAIPVVLTVTVVFSLR